MRGTAWGRASSFALLFVGLVVLGAHRDVRGEVPCFHGITEIACPSAPITDDCQTQFNKLPGPDKDPNGGDLSVAAKSCGKLFYAGRKVGQFGEGEKTPCFSPGGETGQKCKPEVDTDGYVIRVGCGQKYECKWMGLAFGCKKQDRIIETYRADKYTLDSKGCAPKKQNPVPE